MRFFLVTLVVFSVLIACDGNPGRERFPGPQGRTTDLQDAASKQAVMGAGADSVPVESNGSGGAKAPTAAGATLTGRVELPKAAKDKHHFFLSVRPAAGGPPIAVRREMDPKFPYSFELSASDVMIPGTPFEGEVTVTARLKSEGDPLSRAPGDLVAQVQTTIGDKKKLVLMLKPEQLALTDARGLSRHVEGAKGVERFAIFGRDLEDALPLGLGFGALTEL